MSLIYTVILSIIEEGANVTDSAKASSFTDDPGATLAMEEVGALSYESYGSYVPSLPTNCVSAFQKISLIIILSFC